MKKFITLLKSLSFFPAICMMCLIFLFSAQPAEISSSSSQGICYKIITLSNDLFQKDLTDKEIEQYADKLEHPVRKLAHITEYFILAMCVAFPLYVYGLRGLPLLLAAGIFCVGFAATDEFHQSFVAGRGPSVTDVGIDSIGILAALIIVRLITRRHSN